MDFYVVLTTVPTLKAGRKIAAWLLDSKLAACINITSALESHYVWQEKRCRSREYLLFIKTRKSLFGKLSKSLKAVHPYETPEIIALPFKEGGKSYLDWVAAATAQD